MSPTPVSTTPRSRAAFTLAFALCFPMLIALTPLYANVARGVVLQPGFITPGLVLMLALCAHLAAQLGATSALHAREYPATARGRDAIPAALAAGVACAIAALLTPTLLGLTGVEMVYRLFMTAYGLLFPAYVWIVLWTSRASLNTPRTQRLTLALWCAACVVATPFYWIGFVMRIEPWLVPGLAIVLASGPLAAALARRTKSDTRSIF